MSVAETAAAMGKNEPSVKSLQWRAIQSLRLILGRKFDERMPAPGAMR
jgi:DNA-directed RNA polymerase specialized sigma24 family protein